MKFATFTKVEGDPIDITLQGVSAIDEVRGGTRIWMNGGPVVVTEPKQEVKDALSDNEEEETEEQK